MARRVSEPGSVTGGWGPREFEHLKTPKSKRPSFTGKIDGKKKKKETGIAAVIADPDRLAKWLANPGLRSKLPDKYLSKEQQAARKIARDPYHKQIEAMVSTKFADPEREIGQAVQQSDRRQGTLDSWFGEYQRALSAAQAQQQQMQAQQVQGQLAQGQAFSQLAARQIAEQQQAAQADAAARGATVDPGVAAAGQGGALVQRNLSDLAGTVMAGQGANNDAVMNAALAAAVGMQAGAKKDELVRKGGLEEQLRDLLKAKGDFRLQARSELVDADRRAKLEDQVFKLNAATKLNPETGKPYTVETATANREAKTRSDAAKRKADSRKWSRDLNEFGVSNAAWHEWGKSPAGRAKREAAKREAAKKTAKEKKPTFGLGSRSKESEASFIKDVQAAADAIRGGASRRSILTAPGGRSPAERRVIANAANDMAMKGFLSPANVRALRKIGVHVAGFPRSLDAARKAGTIPDPGQRVGSVGEAIVDTIGQPKKKDEKGGG